MLALPPSHSQVFYAQREIHSLRDALRALGLEADVAKLERPDPWFALIYIVVAWTITVLSVTVAVAGATLGVRGLLLILPALFLLGVGQRMLGIVLHDGAHGNAFGKMTTKVGRAMFNVTCAFACFEDVTVYLRDHLRHHAYLAIVGVDPDLNPAYKEGLRRGAQFASARTGMLVAWMSCVFDRRTISYSALGNLTRLKPVGKRRWFARWKVACITWFAVVFAVIAIVVSAKIALLVFMFWCVSRLTTFHMTRVFGELCDHAFSKTRSMAAYARTNPANSPFTPFISAFGDATHTPHHFLMHVPMRHLRKAHSLAMLVPNYRADVSVCDGYFFGSKTVAQSWFDGLRKAPSTTTWIRSPQSGTRLSALPHSERMSLPTTTTSGKNK